MNRGWLTYLLVFSLALNLGTVGAFAYHRYQERWQVDLKIAQPMSLGDLWHIVKLEPAQMEAVQGLFPGHRRLLSETKQELAEKRQELFSLIASESSSRSVIQAKVREISVLQERLEQEIVQVLLEIKQHLKPEQQAAFLSVVQGRLCRSRGGGGRGHGRGRGAGPGHHGPLGPPSGCN